jgi:hypothetical protein
MNQADSPTGASFDPLQSLRNNLQSQSAETVDRAARDARRMDLEARFCSAFEQVIALAAPLLAARETCVNDGGFADLAHSLLAFNATLSEMDREYLRCRMCERLERAAATGVPALATAASLLLTASAADADVLARDLERIQGSHRYDLWPAWLPYILDQLVNSQRPPPKVFLLPDTTRDEWRKAEEAFGCIVFSDEAFRFLQASMDQAASQLEVALEKGGHPLAGLLPYRVRDMLAMNDARALEWCGSEALSTPLLQPPPAIEAITEPALRRPLDEVWTAANCLQIALDKWASWFVELQERKDAHPGVALTCNEMARKAITVLLTHRPNVEPFDRADEAALTAMLPPIPAWFMSTTDRAPDAESPKLALKPRVRWQEDREFLDQYYWPPEARREKAIRLRGAATRLIDMLKSFPTTALAAPRLPAVAADAARSGGPVDVSSELSAATTARDPQGARGLASMLNSLRCESDTKQRQADEVRRAAEERASRLSEHAAMRERLGQKFKEAYLFPGEENRRGGKPGPEGFRRWAEYFVALGVVLRECDDAIKGLNLEQRLRTVAVKETPLAMKYALTLLLLSATGTRDEIASALEQVQLDGDLRRFVLWLPYIFDCLWLPYHLDDKVVFVALPPDEATLEERRLAGEAFGWRPTGACVTAETQIATTTEDAATPISTSAQAHDLEDIEAELAAAEQQRAEDAAAQDAFRLEQALSAKMGACFRAARQVNIEEVRQELGRKKGEPISDMDCYAVWGERIKAFVSVLDERNLFDVFLGLPVPEDADLTYKLGAKIGIKAVRLARSEPAEAVADFMVRILRRTPGLLTDTFVTVSGWFYRAFIRADNEARRRWPADALPDQSVAVTSAGPGNEGAATQNSRTSPLAEQVSLSAVPASPALPDNEKTVAAPVTQPNNPGREGEGVSLRPNEGDKTTSVRWGAWALGVEYEGKWQLFHLVGGVWRHQGVLNTRKGLQHKLLTAFAKGKGILKEAEAIRLWEENPSRFSKSKIKRLLLSEISNLRKLIRKRICEPLGVNGKTTDPLERFAAPPLWKTEIQIGCARTEDGDRVGEETRLRFVPWDDLGR